MAETLPLAEPILIDDGEDSEVAGQPTPRPTSRDSTPIYGGAAAASGMGMLQRLNPDDLLKPERRNEAPPMTLAQAMAKARSAAVKEAAKAGKAGKGGKMPAALPAKLGKAGKPSAALGKGKGVVAGKLTGVAGKGKGVAGKLAGVAGKGKGVVAGKLTGVAGKGKGVAGKLAAASGKGGAGKKKGGKAVDYEIGSGEEEEEEEGSYEEGSYDEEEEGSYEEGSYEEGSYEDEEEGSYEDEEEGSYDEEEEGSYDEEEEEEESESPPRRSSRPTSKGARPTSNSSAGSKGVGHKGVSSKSAGSKGTASKGAIAAALPFALRPAGSGNTADAVALRARHPSIRPSSAHQRAKAASRRAFADDGDSDEEGSGSGSYSEEGSYTEEGSGSGSYSEEGSYSGPPGESSAGETPSLSPPPPASSRRSSRGGGSSAFPARAPKAGGRPSPKKPPQSEREVLALAIREQEKALKGLQRDLKVLRQIEAAWSIDEHEAKRQGIGAQDMALINAFDDEDVSKVREVIAKVAAILETLESEFGQHLRSYQEAVTAMESILQTRAKVINRLDKATGIFSRYPELSQFVAGKQERLAQAMENTQRALLDGFATSLAKVQMTQGQIRDMIQGAASSR